MTPAHRARIRKWVKALRSGKYKQGKNWLRADGQYCCLGVACDVAAKGLGMKWRRPNKEDDVYVFGNYDQVLPTKVAKYYGLGSEDPEIRISGKIVSATFANDGLGIRPKTFKQIADAIEKTFLSDH